MPSALSLVLAALVAAAPASSELGTSSHPHMDAPTVHALNFDLSRSLAIALPSAAVGITLYSPLGTLFAPQTCHWCDRAPDGTDTLNALDLWGRGVAGRSAKSRKKWSGVSDFVGYGSLLMVPVAQFATGWFSGASSTEMVQDLVIVGESVAVALALNQTVKFVVARERPFVHVLTADQKGLTDEPSDNNASFYSAHTSIIFSIVTAAGTVSELRGYSKGWRLFIWGVGLTASASVGLMRMYVDKHYLTDVLVGAAAGSLIGVGIPLLLHGRQTERQTRSTDLTIQVTGGPGGVSLSGVF